MTKEQITCEDCGCQGIQHSWGVECKRCDAESQLNDCLVEQRLLKDVIKWYEAERDIKQWEETYNDNLEKWNKRGS